MKNKFLTKVKICCISSISEAKLAIKYGASALGLVSKMPSGPGIIEEELIVEIANICPPGVTSVLLTSKQDVSSIVKQQKKCKTNAIQIVDTLLEGSYEELKYALPGISIIQVIHVVDENSISEAVKVGKDVDAILLDSGNQKLDIKILGGTGKTHDWNLSRKIVESVHCPVFLAGGLNPDNIKNAVNVVNPYGADLCSGVRTDGKLDEKKLKLFFNNLNS